MTTVTQAPTEEKLYVDYNGTTPLEEKVQAAIANSLKYDWGNPSTMHKFGQSARDAIEKARSQVAAMVNGRADQIIFTSGGTEANNMVISGLCRNRSSVPCHAITTNVEHDSIVLPLKHLQNTELLEITEINVSDYNDIVHNVIAAIKENTTLVTIMAANNETGVIMPLRQIGERLRRVNDNRTECGLPRIVFHSDGAQILGKENVDVAELEIDCFTIVGHKFYGPRIGGLWSRVHVPPLLFGGGCQSRPGTPNTPMIVGLGVAASLVTQNLQSYRRVMETARDHLEHCLGSLPVKVTINCGYQPRLVNTCNVSFALPGTSGRAILSRCERVLAGVGAACHSNSKLPPNGSQVLLNSGVAPSDAVTAIRLSLGRDATESLVEEIVEDLKKALDSIIEENS